MRKPNPLINTIRLIIFYLAVLFIVVAIYTFTIGQASAYEFADNTVKNKFYQIIMTYFPVAFLLTLIATIKKKNSKAKNILVIISTVLISVCSFFLMVSLLFTVGFLTIINDQTLFVRKGNPKITITKQRIGQGALGEDGQRIVEIEPFLKLWYKATPVDTANINKAEWLSTNK